MDVCQLLLLVSYYGTVPGRYQVTKYSNQNFLQYFIVA